MFSKKNNHLQFVSLNQVKSAANFATEVNKLQMWEWGQFNVF